MDGIDRRVLKKNQGSALIIIIAGTTSRVHASKLMLVIVHYAERMEGVDRQGWQMSRQTRVPRDHTSVDDPRS